MRKPLPTEKRGAKMRLAKMLGISRSHITNIFHGRKRCSLELAAKLEIYFNRVNIPITRWDLLYGLKRGQNLDDYIYNRVARVRSK